MKSRSARVEQSFDGGMLTNKTFDASSLVPSVRDLKSDQHISSPSFGHWIALLLIVLFGARVQAAESLYDTKTAKKIDISKLSLFGLQASKFRYDSRMMHAAEIASARAHAHSQGSCWRYVKDALISAGLVDSRPKTEYAKEAASELSTSYGFQKLRVSDPFSAPVGSVLVYGGRGAGHVEFRTRQGFVSDFTSPSPSHRPLIGVYVKP